MAARRLCDLKAHPRHELVTRVGQVGRRLDFRLPPRRGKTCDFKRRLFPQLLREPLIEAEITQSGLRRRAIWVD